MALSFSEYHRVGAAKPPLLGSAAPRQQHQNVCGSAPGGSGLPRQLEFQTSADPQPPSRSSRPRPTRPGSSSKQSPTGRDHSSSQQRQQQIDQQRSQQHCPAVSPLSACLGRAISSDHGKGHQKLCQSIATAAATVTAADTRRQHLNHVVAAAQRCNLKPVDVTAKDLLLHALLPEGLLLHPVCKSTHTAAFKVVTAAQGRQQQQQQQQQLVCLSCGAVCHTWTSAETHAAAGVPESSSRVATTALLLSSTNGLTVEQLLAEVNNAHLNTREQQQQQQRQQEQQVGDAAVDDGVDCKGTRWPCQPTAAAAAAVVPGAGADPESTLAQQLQFTCNAVSSSSVHLPVIRGKMLLSDRLLPPGLQLDFVKTAAAAGGGGVVPTVIARFEVVPRGAPGDGQQQQRHQLRCVSCKAVFSTLAAVDRHAAGRRGAISKKPLDKLRLVGTQGVSLNEFIALVNESIAQQQQQQQQHQQQEQQQHDKVTSPAAPSECPPPPHQPPQRPAAAPHSALAVTKTFLTKKDRQQQQQQLHDTGAASSGVVAAHAEGCESGAAPYKALADDRQHTQQQGNRGKSAAGTSRQPPPAAPAAVAAGSPVKTSTRRKTRQQQGSSTAAAAAAAAGSAVPDVDDLRPEDSAAPGAAVAAAAARKQRYATAAGAGALTGKRKVQPPSSRTAAADSTCVGAAKRQKPVTDDHTQQQQQHVSVVCAAHTSTAVQHKAPAAAASLSLAAVLRSVADDHHRQQLHHLMSSSAQQDRQLAAAVLAFWRGGLTATDTDIAGPPSRSAAVAAAGCTWCWSDVIRDEVAASVLQLHQAAAHSLAPDKQHIITICSTTLQQAYGQKTNGILQVSVVAADKQQQQQQLHQQQQRKLVLHMLSLASQYLTSCSSGSSSMTDYHRLAVAVIAAGAVVSNNITKLRDSSSSSNSQVLCGNLSLLLVAAEGAAAHLLQLSPLLAPDTWRRLWQVAAAEVQEWQHNNEQLRHSSKQHQQQCDAAREAPAAAAADLHVPGCFPEWVVVVHELLAVMSGAPVAWQHMMQLQHTTAVRKHLRAALSTAAWSNVLHTSISSADVPRPWVRHHTLMKVLYRVYTNVSILRRRCQEHQAHQQQQQQQQVEGSTASAPSFTDPWVARQTATITCMSLLSNFLHQASIWFRPHQRHFQHQDQQPHQLTVLQQMIVDVVWLCHQTLLALLLPDPDLCGVLSAVQHHGESNQGLMGEVDTWVRSGQLAFDDLIQETIRPPQSQKEAAAVVTTKTAFRGEVMTGVVPVSCPSDWHTCDGITVMECQCQPHVTMYDSRLLAQHLEKVLTVIRMYNRQRRYQITSSNNMEGTAAAATATVPESAATSPAGLLT